MDLAETDSIDNPHWQPVGGKKIPYNKANTLYDEVTAIDGMRDVKQSNALLASLYGGYNINGGEDYEKIESARRLDLRHR